MSQIRMPNEIISGSMHNWTVGHYIVTGRHESAEIFFLRLPPFQRPAVWTQSQQIKFIESMWLGLDLGRIVYTQVNQPALQEFNWLLIDGQQRLTALKLYVENAFPVFGLYHKELHEVDRRMMEISRALPATVITERNYLNWEKLEDLYIRMNYGGTAHAPEHHPHAKKEAS
jgi:uncharacterized protein with ParB-like and HNH nuclease domain